MTGPERLRILLPLPNFSLLSVLQLFILLAGLNAMAFPDTIRHGYFSCTTCHQSAAGGGLLTDYGRSLSKELISTWGAPKEEQLFHGLFSSGAEENTSHQSPRLQVGGDIRSLFRQVKTPVSKTNEGFLMQAQLRFGFAAEKLKAAVTIGKIENPRASKEIRWVGTEYYLSYAMSEESQVRTGRFEPIFGLRLPDHNLWVRSEIGFVPWSERDSLENIFENEKMLVSLAGFQSTSSMATGMQATGYTGTIIFLLFEKSRIGFSFLNSEGQGTRSRMASLHSTLTFRDEIYLHSELSQSSNLAVKKDLGFHRLGFEFTKGLTALLQTQSKADQRKSGFGFIWTPRPHFEFFGILERLDEQEEFNLVLHYYL